MTASALLRGARGNSGVILSLLFRGFSKALKGKLEADGRDFAAALTAGVEAAYKAVMKPAEGTILTVSRLTADAARDLAEENCEIGIACSSTAIGHRARRARQYRQPEPRAQKGRRRRRGRHGLLPDPARHAREPARQRRCLQRTRARRMKQADFTAFLTLRTSPLPSTRSLSSASARMITSLDPLREYLGSIGDSLVIGEDDEAFKVHVHTNIPGRRAEPRPRSTGRWSWQRSRTCACSTTI